MDKISPISNNITPTELASFSTASIRVNEGRNQVLQARIKPKHAFKEKRHLAEEETHIST